MNNKPIFQSLLLILIIGIASCNKKVAVTQQSTPAPTQSRMSAGPPVIIYKTKKDYTTNIPIMLSDDKKTVVNYPDIKDIYFNNELAVPAHLANGYLLDNRGIGPNCAFTQFTYESYSKLKITPSPNDFLPLLIDSDPLLEMYNCGTKYQYSNIIDELNKKITEGKLGEFKRLK